MCAACQIARAKRQNPGVITTQPDPAARNVTFDAKIPGDTCSIDQYVCHVRGRLPGSRGREKESHTYGGGTIFVDHVTGKIYTYHQVTFSAEETVQAKLAYERELEQCGRKVKHYHADNGIFKSAEFKESIQILNQKITFSGVGAHHQNGKAERAIQTIVEKARAMMLHVSMHWPEYFDMDLWPYAIDYATFIYNHTPQMETGVAPIEHMANVHMNCKHIARCKVFGCPVYVLQAKLQDGKKIPKWKPRARMGQFLGFSRDHSSLVGLVRNLRTEHVSPQWHIVFDKRFETVTTTDADEEDATAAIWTNLFNAPESRDWYFDENDTSPTTVPPQLDPEWQDNDDLETARTRRQRRRARIRAQAQAAQEQQEQQDDDEQSESQAPAPSKDDDIRPASSGETRNTGSTPTLLDDSPEEECSDSDSSSDSSSSSSDSEEENDGSTKQGVPVLQQAPPQGEPAQRQAPNQGEPQTGRAPGRAPGRARRREVHPNQL
jgi:hypothetical protein